MRHEKTTKLRQPRTKTKDPDWSGIMVQILGDRTHRNTYLTTCGWTYPHSKQVIALWASDHRLQRRLVLGACAVGIPLHYSLIPGLRLF